MTPRAEPHVSERARLLLETHNGDTEPVAKAVGRADALLRGGSAGLRCLARCICRRSLC